MEDIEFIEDDDEEEGAVGGDDAAEKCRKRERDIQKKVRKFWTERGLVKYSCEWQTHSASYMEECVKHIKALKNKVFSLVCRKHFERITSSTYTLGAKKEEACSKYLHLKSSDNNLAWAIQRYLDCKDCALIYVIIFTFSVLYRMKIVIGCGILLFNILYFVKHIMHCMYKYCKMLLSF